MMRERIAPPAVRLAAVLCMLAGVLAARPVSAECVPPGMWVVPGGGRLAPGEVIARAARAQAVLLGENHDSAEHHRWQLHVLAALAAARPGLMLGVEMLPRSSQPALDRWVAGQSSEAEFMRESNWRGVWGVDFALYAPLFHFARMHRVPMLALNIDRALVRKVGAQGFDALSEAERGGLTRPAPASAGYRERLYESFASHAGSARDRAGAPEALSRASAPEAQSGTSAQEARAALPFLRFVEAQQVWDRAMAQAIANALARSAEARPRSPQSPARAPEAYVVALMGSGHVAWGDGVARQLADLGIARVASLLPWDSGEDCATLRAGLADAVFGVLAQKAPPRFRLGVTLGATADGLRVESVQPGSAAAGSGLRAADILVEAAGVALTRPEDLIAVVERAAAGYLLPMKVRRSGATLEIVIPVPSQP